MESILVAFLRQLGVQDELRRSLDSGLFFTGRVPLRISQLGPKYSNITLNQSLVGKKKFPWKVAFDIEDIHVFAMPPSPIGGIWGNWPQIRRAFTSNGQWHEFSKRFDAHIKLSPGEGADLWPSASFWVFFLIYYTTAKDEDHCLRSRREMTQQNNWRHDLTSKLIDKPLEPFLSWAPSLTKKHNRNVLARYNYFSRIIVENT